MVKMRIFGASASLVAAFLCGCVPTVDVVVGNGPGEARSFAEAVAQVRELRASGRAKDRVAVIGVKPGRWRMNAPVVLTPEDSHLRVVGSGAERSVFDGGLELPPFKVGRNGVWETDVPPGAAFDQLWVNGRRATLARSPNRFYYYMKDICPDAPDTAFVAEPEDIAQLSNLPKSELDRVAVSYWQSWDMGYVRIRAADFASGRLDFKTGSLRPFFFWHKTRPRYALENFRGALDAPGEWFHDVKHGKLLYIPLGDESVATACAVAPVVRGLVTFDGNRARGLVIRDITFKDVGFEHTALPIGNGIGNFQAAMNVKDSAITGKGVEALRLVNCRVAHTGGHGMMLWDGSRDVSVEHSIFEDLGAGAIGFSGANSTKDEDGINEGLTVRDSIIRHGGRVVQGAIGVWIGHARDCLVEHNDIYDFYYTGISCGWTWGYGETICRRNRIAFNRVHHIGQGVLSDMGAIYTLGDNGRSEVCNNWVSDVDGYADNGSPTFGMYTDEGSRGFLFASNLVENCRYCALHQHYGRDNVFVNNVCVGFENCAVLRSRSERHVTMALTNNVFWWRSSKTMAYSGWGSFEDMLKDLPADGNIYWCKGGPITNTAFKGGDWLSWQKGGNDRRGAVADPLFFDAEHGDWRLHEDSLALKAGFVPFDWKEAGVFKHDPGWVTRASERTWDGFERLPRAPRFSTSSFEFDGAAYMSTRDRIGKRMLFVSETGRKEAFVKSPDGMALRLIDSTDERFKFAPHLCFTPPIEGDAVNVSFEFRPIRGEGMSFEIRDYQAEDTFKVAARIKYADGTIVLNGEPLAPVEHGHWFRVEVKLAQSGAIGSPLTAVVMDEDGKPLASVSGKWLDPEFKRPTWYGFMTYGDGASVWDLKNLTISR